MHCFTVLTRSIVFIKISRKAKNCLKNMLMNSIDTLLDSHLKLLLDLNQISVLTNEEIEELLTIARDDARRYSSNSGYVHLFADFVATVFEEGRGDVVS